MTDERLYARATCSALVITCSDFRFKRAERSFADIAAPGDDYDLIARPGAIRSLVAPRNDAARDSLHDEIALLQRLHGFTRVLMVNHLSCRAYDDLASPDNERAVHVDHLRAAAASILRDHPDVAAEPYLISIVDGALRVESIAD